jgi:hypothetical protein
MNEAVFRRELFKRLRMCDKARLALNKVPGQSFNYRPKGSISSADRHVRLVTLDGQESMLRALLRWLDQEAERETINGPKLCEAQHGSHPSNYCREEWGHKGDHCDGDRLRWPKKTPRKAKVARG